MAEALIVLTGERAEPIGFLAMPTFGLVGTRTLVSKPDPGRKTLVRANVPDKIQGRAHAATGTITFFPSPRDELSQLAPTSVGPASLSSFALTVAGAIEA